MEKSKDALGDIMKGYESAFTSNKVMKGIPLLARLDGRAFHTFAKGLARPYDGRLTDCMVETTAFLIEQTHALTGYTQSDEITLLWYFDANSTSEYMFNGKISKLNSVLASLATVKFYSQVQQNIPEKKHLFPIFDCRVWQVPTKSLAADVFIWRELDATKNSVSMAAHSMFSHKSLQGLSSKQMKDRMINEANVNWNLYPAFFKRGSYLQKRNYFVEYTEEERMAIPEKYRPAVDEKVERSKVVTLDMAPCRLVDNFEDVIFNKADPINKADIFKCKSPFASK